MISRESEAAFWNQADTVHYFASKGFNPQVAARVGALGIGKGTAALDLGCGGGRHAELLAKAGFSTTAVDANLAMLARTRQRTAHLSKRVSLVKADISHIPMTENTFSLVISTGVLHQARSAVGMNQAVGEVARATKKGGIFVGNIFVSDIWDDTYTIPDPKRPEFVETKERVGMTLVDTGRAMEMFEQNGFRFETDPTITSKQENTGPRGVLHFSAELTR